MKSIFSIVSGGIIGLGIFTSVSLLLKAFGTLGLLFLPVILALAAFLVLLVVCLPYYFEERKAFKEWEEKHIERLIS